MTRMVLPGDLQPGDVLLSLGIGKTSTAIRMLAGGDYSHAALWSGERVIEATTPRVQEHTLEESLKNHPREYVDVFRYEAIPPGKAAVVVSTARESVDTAYSYGDLFLCASLMAVASRMPRRGQIPFLKDACEFFHFMKLDRPPLGEHMTCTKLVVVAYNAAGLALHIQPVPVDRVDVRSLVDAAGELARDSVSKDMALDGDQKEEWLAFQAELRIKCAQLGAEDDVLDSAEPKGPLRGWDGRTPVRAVGEWRSSLITPCNLAQSPDLISIGRLYSAPGAQTQPGTPAR